MGVMLGDTVLILAHFHNLLDLELVLQSLVALETVIVAMNVAAVFLFLDDFEHIFKILFLWHLLAGSIFNLNLI